MSALDGLTADVRRVLRKRKQPGWIPPMLATLTDEHFSHPDWIYEPKWDGERILAYRTGRGVRLFSRNRKAANASYPELVDALDAQPSGDFIVDGEVVAYDGTRTSFARLQPRMHVSDPAKARRTGVAVHYCVFDVLHLDGYDTTAVPLLARKKIVKAALRTGEPLRFTSHRRKNGEAYLAEMCAKGEEGVIAKLASGRYQPGRSKLWLKFKCVLDQEFVVGGFTDPRGGRVGIGALLIGYHDDAGLRYAGKVGTGFDTKLLGELRRELEPLETDRSPFVDAPRFKAVHWVRPRLVAQIGFTEWTRDGRLRHPRYLGARRDKDPREVVRET